MWGFVCHYLTLMEDEVLFFLVAHTMPLVDSHECITFSVKESHEDFSHSDSKDGLAELFLKNISPESLFCSIQFYLPKHLSSCPNQS
jgi:hypothetical protein